MKFRLICCTPGVSLASIYCNCQTRRAFTLIFRAFFDAIERVTGRPLTFWQFDQSQGKLRGVIFNAEPAQIQAFGDHLLTMNDSRQSGVNEPDPLKLVLYVTKTCSVHFHRSEPSSVSVECGYHILNRNIDKLPKHIPQDVIHRLKSIFGLNTQEEINQWHDFCATTPYTEVTSMLMFCFIEITRLLIMN